MSRARKAPRAKASVRKTVAAAARKTVSTRSRPTTRKAVKTVSTSPRKTATKPTAVSKKTAGNKTTVNAASVNAFLASIPDAARREECRQVLALMKTVTGEAPKMWGATIVGFGTTHYTYETGREGDWFPIGFSPRKANLTLYFMHGFDRHPALMQQLGVYTTGKSCLYLKRLSDIDLTVLEQLLRASL